MGAASQAGCVPVVLVFARVFGLGVVFCVLFEVPVRL